MKIAHLIFGLPLAGTETMLVSIVNRQVLTDNDIYVYIVNDLIDGQLCDSIDKRVKVIRLNRKLHSVNPMPLLALNWHLLRLNPDIIHIHSANLPQYLLGSLRRKSLMTLHTLPCEFHDKGVRLTPVIDAISDAVADAVKVRYDRDATVIANGIDTAAFAVRKHKTKADRKNSFRIACVGRLKTKVKGQDILVKAVSMLPENLRSQVTLDLIGEGESHDELSALISSLGLEGSVHLAGTFSQDYLYKNMCGYDLFVLPSRYEGFGLTVAEAMAAGVPVLVSDAMGPFEVIERGRCGYSFTCGDASACRDALVSIISSDDDMSMIERALDRVRTLYDVSVTADNYIKEYQKIIAQR